jgi:hypothetical protein
VVGFIHLVGSGRLNCEVIAKIIAQSSRVVKDAHYIGGGMSEVSSYKIRELDKLLLELDRLERKAESETPSQQMHPYPEVE